MENGIIAQEVLENAGPCTMSIILQNAHKQDVARSIENGYTQLGVINTQHSKYRNWDISGATWRFAVREDQLAEGVYVKRYEIPYLSDTGYDRHTLLVSNSLLDDCIPPEVLLAAVIDFMKSRDDNNAQNALPHLEKGFAELMRGLSVGGS